MRIILVLFLVLIRSSTFAQTCEDINPDLFKYIPENIPKKSNCKDTLGRKQGWWIAHTKSYRLLYIKDSPDSAEPINTYTFGNYLNDKKIGHWKSIHKVHSRFDETIDNYYYAEDTILITSAYYEGGWHYDTLYYNSDSSIIKYNLTYSWKPGTLCIECNKHKKPFSKSCRMTYRNKLIKEFSYNRFELEFERSSFMYGREKAQIDQSFVDNRKKHYR